VITGGFKVVEKNVMVSKTDQKKIQSQKPWYWIALTLVYLVIPLVLLVSGWDLIWWQAWVYSAIIIAAGIGMRVWSGRRHPGLLAERANFGKAKDVKPWDKVLAPLMSVSTAYPLYIVAGLDHRFDWSPVFPLWLNIIGIFFCMAGYSFAGWALVENRFFSSTVRIQVERGHAVCDSGPYRIIRHPGYAGNLLPLAGIVMALGSVWTIIPAALALMIAVTRTELEDRTLQEELPGYQEYAQRVRYRLIPWIY
jgi:protein-S-isoprenylcysteine O-methyltransferase Ste14